jgi:hypothetical protein
MKDEPILLPVELPHFVMYTLAQQFAHRNTLAQKLKRQLPQTLAEAVSSRSQTCIAGTSERFYQCSCKAARLSGVVPENWFFESSEVCL